MSQELRLSLTIDGIDAKSLTSLAVALVNAGLLKPPYKRSPAPYPEEGPLLGKPLTLRERQVLELIAAGRTNKETGVHLGISSRTIEVHRARVMEKLGAKNAADLVRMTLSGKQKEPSPPKRGGPITAGRSD